MKGKIKDKALKALIEGYLKKCGAETAWAKYIIEDDYLYETFMEAIEKGIYYTRGRIFDIVIYGDSKKPMEMTEQEKEIISNWFKKNGAIVGGCLERIEEQEMTEEFLEYARNDEKMSPCAIYTTVAYGNS